MKSKRDDVLVSVNPRPKDGTSTEIPNDNTAKKKFKWTVYHPDGEEFGLRPVTFDSKKIAQKHAALWNKKYAGHRTVPEIPNDNPFSELIYPYAPYFEEIAWQSENPELSLALAVASVISLLAAKQIQSDEQLF